MLPPGNHRRAFHWRKYRRSTGDSCIANEPPENAQWNAPFDSTSTNAEIWRLNQCRFYVTLTTISDQRPQNMQNTRMNYDVPDYNLMCIAAVRHL